MLGTIEKISLQAGFLSPKPHTFCPLDVLKWHVTPLVQSLMGSQYLLSL